jgi:hypothetical protein
MSLYIKNQRQSYKQLYGQNCRHKEERVKCRGPLEGVPLRGTHGGVIMGDNLKGSLQKILWRLSPRGDSHKGGPPGDTLRGFMDLLHGTPSRGPSRGLPQVDNFQGTPSSGHTKGTSYRRTHTDGPLRERPPGDPIKGKPSS